MSSGTRIRLEGHPEKVQLLADLIDDALPDVVTWQNVPFIGADGTIRVSGTTTPFLILERERD